MNYTIDRTFDATGFDAVVERARLALAAEGFGILTEIDVKATLKNKIGADVDDYLILGACNPAMAHKAMQMEPRIGAMLPCNVIVRNIGEGQVEVNAVDPLASMDAVDNAALKEVASIVRGMLETAIGNI
ncbi:MAG: DUF302 domain-containing protein [Hyphomicrobiales bacterium]|nr:DUF302 domain-containing protein [Hyphomicrobiales bacterium]